MTDINWFDFIFTIIDVLSRFANAVMDALTLRIPLDFSLSIFGFEMSLATIYDLLGLEDVPQDMTVLSMLGGAGLTLVIVLSVIKLIPIL